MDVRCEKCLTIYELDDSKVGAGGLTVKCQECGNLFKVRRRTTTAEIVAGAGAGVGAGTTSPQRAASEEPVTKAEAVAPKVEERGWLLRRPSVLGVTGEVLRFRELTTLQQWIVERKVTRADEISRGGESWKQLGQIAELASFFHVVEQAEAVAHSSQPGLAVQKGTKVDAGFGAEALADLPTAIVTPHRMQQLQGFGADRDQQGPTSMGVPAELEDDPTTGVTSRSHGALYAITLVLLLSGGAGFWYWQHTSQPKESPAQAQAAELVRRGKAAFALDTDDGFRQAISLLDQAVELDPTSIAARVELGEAHLTWAAYLKQDAHALHAGGDTAAQTANTLSAEASAHLERARRVLEEPGSDNQDSTELARAFGDLLRVEGAPAAAVERNLKRASENHDAPIELAYSFGELDAREGKTADAIARLTEASTGGLARAAYRLAAIAMEADNKADALRDCTLLFKISPHHERGHALCPQEMADAGAVASGPVVAPLPVAVAIAAAHVDAGVAPHDVAVAAVREVVPMDYKALVREADHLSENGKSPAARKLYERALELDHRGVAALTGLGYCDLDAERYMQAVDRFDAALQVDPSSGDAMLGLAESYKVRGQTPRAIEFYKKYLAAHPGGSKAQMAQKNLRDLEPHTAKEGEGTDRVTIKNQDTDTSLPKPPLDEPPP